MLALRLPSDLEKRLDSRKKDWPHEIFLRSWGIVKHIDELEDIYLAELELEKIRKGVKTHSIDDVRRELGLDDWVFRRC